jgi:ADP-ribose pyrophosphatase
VAGVLQAVNMAGMDAWTVLDTNDGSAGYLPVVHRRYALPDGTEAVWDIFGGAASVSILAITDDDEVVLARQFRPGPGRVLDELPGGYVEPGEDVIVAAGRELLEETGYAGQLELAGSSWLASSALTRRYVVVARNANRVATPSPEPGEFVEVVLMSMSGFRDHLRGGELTDVDLGYLALDHLGLLG